jgi:hypothetical protein
MAAAGTVIRLAARFLQVPFGRPGFKRIEQSTVVKQRVGATPLGVAGYLALPEGEIRKAADGEAWRLQRTDEAPKD